MSKKIYSIKQRIVEYVEYQGIQKGEFFKKIGMTPQSFRGDAMNAALNSDALANILSECPNLNPYWLLLGEGKMIVDPASQVQDNSQLKEKLRTLENEVALKDKIIELLEERVEYLTEKIPRLHEKQPKAGGG